MLYHVRNRCQHNVCVYGVVSCGKKKLTDMVKNDSIQFYMCSYSLFYYLLRSFISYDFGAGKVSSVERKNMKLASESCGAI